MTNLKLQKSTLLNPADPLAEQVLNKAGVTIGSKTVFGPVIGVSQKGRLIIEEGNTLVEYAIVPSAEKVSVGKIVGKIN